MLLLALALSSGLPHWGGVPQIVSANNAYFEADPVKGDVDGVLLCRVDVAGGRSWDTFGAVDLAVTLSFGDQRFEMWGEEDRANGFVTAAAVKLKTGTKVTLLVEDRDVTSNEHIARGQLTYDGASLAFDLHETQVACKTIPAARAATRAQPYLSSAQKKATAFSKAKPNLRDPNGGWPLSEEYGVESDLRAALAWTGPTAETKKQEAETQKQKQTFAAALASAAHAFPKTTSGTNAKLRASIVAGGVKLEALQAPLPGSMVRVDVIGADGVIVDRSPRDAFLASGLKKGDSIVVPLPPLDGALVVRVTLGFDDLIPLKP